jgi:hypothetical protein
VGSQRGCGFGRRLISADLTPPLSSSLPTLHQHRFATDNTPLPVGCSCCHVSLLGIQTGTTAGAGRLCFPLHNAPASLSNTQTGAGTSSAPPPILSRPPHLYAAEQHGHCQYICNGMGGSRVPLLTVVLVLSLPVSSRPITARCPSPPSLPTRPFSGHRTPRLVVCVFWLFCRPSFSNQ